MSEIKETVEELKNIHDGDAWHGPALMKLLSGVTAEQANAKPIAGAHSIWELVQHIMAWENVLRLRLEGRDVSTPPEGDFPPVGGTGQQAWAETLSRLNESHALLIGKVAALEDSALEEKVANKYTIRFLIDGTDRHHVYHAGQIAVLIKALAK
jgi:uncharacterized damage-inducible protein DinB